MAVSCIFPFHPLMLWLFTVLFPLCVIYIQYVNIDKQPAKLGLLLYLQCQFVTGERL